MSPTTLQNAKRLQMSGMRAQRLIEKMASLPEDAVVLVDGDNVRGKTSFSISKEQLLADTHKLTERCGLSERLHLYYDHGKEHEAFRVLGTTLIFSGERTADDAIARDVGWWKEKYGSHVIVITADSGLKARCHRAAKADNKALTVIDSSAFLEAMEALTTVNRSEHAFVLSPSSAPSSTVPPNMPAVTSALDLRDLLRLELRLRDQVRSLQRLSKMRSGGRKKRSQFARRLAEIETRLQNCLDKQQQKQTTMASANTVDTEVSNSKHVRIDSLDEDTLADILRDEKHGGHGRERREETWERCILAERLRKKVLRSLVMPDDGGADGGRGQSFSNVSLPVAGVRYPDATETDSRTMKASDVYIEQLNRNFSNTDFEGLLLMPMEQARTLLCGDSEPYDKDSNSGQNSNHVEHRSDVVAPLPLRSLARPLSTLELRAQRSLRDASKHPQPFSSGVTTDGVPYSTDALGCRCFNVSLTGKAVDGGKGDILMKIVTISDTHAMELALDGLVPEGDVLIHAGDYAGGAGIKSGRGNKNGKKRSRALDQWLATLAHPVKLVVRGNHDPLMPEFECSGALHFHDSGEVTLEKYDDSSVISVRRSEAEHRPIFSSSSSSSKRLRLGISPYGSRAVPQACDILVSHSPPRGVLDATLSKRKDSQGLPLVGKPAGSSELLEAAAKQWTAPRHSDGNHDDALGAAIPPLVWLVGHIHESYGAKRYAPWKKDEKLGEDESDILCINAACANPGPASSLVNLPTVVNVFD